MVHIVNAAYLQDLRGFVRVTYEITYRLPDFKNLLNTFIHEREDRAPDYPELCAYLNWWDKNIEGPIHSIRATKVRLITPREMKHVGHEFRLH